VAGGLEAGEAQEAAAVDVDAAGVVRAAGGIVRRAGAGDGDAAVLLVHRPRYDDWTFPKGKNETGERDEDAALREVEEETGYRCELGDPVGETRYEDSKGRPKVVRYWVMTPTHDHTFTPNREVDALHWCTRREAGKLLTYDHDRRLLAELPDDVL
jgi:8-oxo-dGTP pyrophosphatase MutT (NUDIX family)